MNSGDTAWILASAALVLLMTPGLAFFYGGLVRRKNVNATIMYSFMAIGIVSISDAEAFTAAMRPPMLPVESVKKQTSTFEEPGKPSLIITRFLMSSVSPGPSSTITVSGEIESAKTLGEKPMNIIAATVTAKNLRELFFNDLEIIRAPVA